MAAAGNDNTNPNSNNIVLTIKDTKLYAPVATLSAKYSQKLSKVLSIGMVRSVYWDECKSKSKKKYNKWLEMFSPIK